MVLLTQSGYMVPKGDHLAALAQGRAPHRAACAARHLPEPAQGSRGRPCDRPSRHHRDAPRADQAVRVRRSAESEPGGDAQACAGAQGRRAAGRCEPDDFEIYENDYGSSSSTVLCLDMSWSMSWEGRFAAAKKVAMAMETLIRSKFPRDYFSIVGFFTRAVELKLKDLPEASWNMGDPFTNLQDGLRLASRFARTASVAQPAHHRDHRRAADRVLPEQAAVLRMAAVVRRHQHARGAGDAEGSRAVTRKGITINTFMLDDSPSLRAFVEKMTQINRGRALYHASRPSRRIHAGRLSLQEAQTRLTRGFLLCPRRCKHPSPPHLLWRGSRVLGRDRFLRGGGHRS